MARLLLALVLSAATACADPHAPPVIDRLDCAQCHEGEYEAAAVHAEQGYGTKCYACHGTAAWAPADPRHREFPIGREPHAGYDCAACHVDLDDREEVSCIDCHAHTRGRTDPFHLGSDEYTYEPRSCLRCHRRGDD